MYKKLDCFSEDVKHRFGEYFRRELLRFLADKSKNLEAPNSSRERVKLLKIELMKELFKFNREKMGLFEECFPNNP